jgi:hypothetical protein
MSASDLACVEISSPTVIPSTSSMASSGSGMLGLGRDLRSDLIGAVLGSALMTIFFFTTCVPVGGMFVLNGFKGDLQFRHISDDILHCTYTLVKNSKEKSEARKKCSTRNKYFSA